MVYGIAAILAGMMVTGASTTSSIGYLYEACDGAYVREIKGESAMFDLTDSNSTWYIFSDRDEDDLANKRLIRESDMDYLVDHYVGLHPESAFVGCGEAFIRASNETGLDPLFFFALAGIESGWGTSDIHVKKHNPYSIGMYGDGVHNGYSLGDTFAEGIVSGAKYIYENYYKNGQTTLYGMNHAGDHSYCAEDPEWEYQIAAEMEYLNFLLDKKHQREGNDI